MDATDNTDSAIGDMYSSKLMESIRSLSFDSSIPWITDLSARQKVAVTHARNPKR